jgi:hypothetical protein
MGTCTLIEEPGLPGINDSSMHTTHNVIPVFSTNKYEKIISFFSKQHFFPFKLIINNSLHKIAIKRKNNIKNKALET